MKQIKKSLKYSGQCLFIENMSGTIFHQILRNKYGAGKNGWQYPSLSDFKEMSKTFNQTQFNTFGILGSTRKNSGILENILMQNMIKYSLAHGITSMPGYIKNESICNSSY